MHINQRLTRTWMATTHLIRRITRSWIATLNLKQRLTRAWMAALTPEEQLDMVHDFVDWLYSDLSPAERKVKAERIGPRLIEWISTGNIGLPLLLYQRLKRWRWVTGSSRPAGKPRQSKEEAPS